MTIELTTLFLSLALLIGVARLLGEIARRFHQPAILGELLAGVLLGPTVFGQIAPQWQAFLFPTSGANAIVLQGIGSLAIVLFMLVSGMEVDLSAVWKQGRAAITIGTLGTIVPFATGVIAAVVAPLAFGRQEGADPMIFALFLATAMAISALPVIAKTLMDLDLYRTDLGMVVISAAIFNDLIGWTIFAIILGMMGTHAAGFSVPMTIVLTLAYAGLILTVGRWLMHRILPFLQAYTHSPGGVLGFAATAALCGAALTEWIGVHAIFGAFLVGVALGDSTHLQERTRVIVDQFVSFIFAPLFFATLGLKMNFIAELQPGLVLSIVFLACVGKLIGATWGARWGGFAARDSWAIGFAMNARGAMEIILGTLALNAGIIEKPLFVALVVMAIFTSAISGPLMRRILRRQQPHRILSYVAAKLFLPNMAAESRLEAIRELAAAAGQQAGLDAAEIERQAWAREQVTATGIGNGVAIPSARLPNLKEPVVVVGVSEAGVPFDAPDGQPAHVMFLIITPQEDSSVLLDLSADIAQLYREPRCLERTQRAANITELLAVFKTTVRR